LAEHVAYVVNGEGKICPETGRIESCTNEG
jgi:hypothetical protein